jgi:primosomal protein N' (replication factor Y)
MHQVEKLSLKLNNEDAIILGPAPAPFSKLNKQYRYHLIIKAKTAALMSQVVNYYKKKLIPQSKISFYIDIDPLSLM